MPVRAFLVASPGAHENHISTEVAVPPREEYMTWLANTYDIAIENVKTYVNVEGFGRVKYYGTKFLEEPIYDVVVTLYKESPPCPSENKGNEVLKSTMGLESNTEPVYHDMHPAIARERVADYHEVISHGDEIVVANQCSNNGNKIEAPMDCMNKQPAVASDSENNDVDPMPVSEQVGGFTDKHNAPTEEREPTVNRSSPLQSCTLEDVMNWAGPQGNALLDQIRTGDLDNKTTKLVVKQFGAYLMQHAKQQHNPSMAETRALVRHLIPHLERDILSDTTGRLCRHIRNRRTVMARKGIISLREYKKRERLNKCDYGSMEELNKRLQVMSNNSPLLADALEKTRPYRIEMYERHLSVVDLFRIFPRLSFNTDLLLSDFGSRNRKWNLSEWKEKFYSVYCDEILRYAERTLESSAPQPDHWSELAALNVKGITAISRLFELTRTFTSKKCRDDFQYIFTFAKEWPTIEGAADEWSKSHAFPTIMIHGRFMHNHFLLVQGQWIDSGADICSALTALIALHQTLHIKLHPSVHSTINLIELMMGVSPSEPVAKNTKLLFSCLANVGG